MCVLHEYDSNFIKGQIKTKQTGICIFLRLAGAQRSCGFPTSGDIQGWVGWALCSLSWWMGTNPWQGVGTWWTIRSLPTQTRLRFYNSSKASYHTHPLETNGSKTKMGPDTMTKDSHFCCCNVNGEKSSCTPGKCAAPCGLATEKEAVTYFQ